MLCIHLHVQCEEDAAPFSQSQIIIFLSSDPVSRWCPSGVKYTTIHTGQFTAWNAMDVPLSRVHRPSLQAYLSSRNLRALLISVAYVGDEQVHQSTHAAIDRSLAQSTFQTSQIYVG